jgi:type III pantothenate kinase
VTAVWLTVDRGHTTLDCMLHRGETALLRARLDPQDAPGIERFVARETVVGIAAASVVPDGLDQVQRWARQRDLPFLLAGRELPCPLAIDYEDPRALGVDRWVGAYAAHRMFGDAVVADCGTAVTINAVTREGRFVGGAIGPGLQALLAGMQARTPRLPIADVRAGRPRLPAPTTEEAVNAGVAFGFCGLVERLVGEVAAAAGLQPATRVATGGDADVLLRAAQSRFEPVPDLVHRGLRWLLQRHGSSC